MKLKEIMICFCADTFFNVYDEFGLTKFRGLLIWNVHEPIEELWQREISEVNVIVEDDGEPVVQIHLMPEEIK